jgi:hypothetical protein
VGLCFFITEIDRCINFPSFLQLLIVISVELGGFPQTSAKDGEEKHGIGLTRRSAHRIPGKLSVLQRAV